MTVSAQDLADYSPFQVSDTITTPGYITNTLFTKLAALSKNKLDREDPGFSTEEYNHAHALLIAHLIAARAGNLERTSERLDNYSYSKSAGRTSFLVQYNALVADARTYLREKPTQLIAHSDCSLGPMKLDKNDIPRLYDSGDVWDEFDDEEP